MERQLFGLKKDGSFTYFVVDPGFCDMCGGDFGVIFNHVVDWNGRKNKLHLICDNCLRKGKKPALFHSQEWKRCFGAEDVRGLPYGVHPISITHHGFKSSNSMSVFDMAVDRKTDCEVDDRTVLAGRESFDGAQIGVHPQDLVDKRPEDVFLLLKQQDEEEKKDEVQKDD